MLNTSTPTDLVTEEDMRNLIIRDKREIFTKQNQRWEIRKENWMQFQKESKITRVRDQNTIKEAYSYLVKTILQVAEKTNLKKSPETKKRPPVPWWNKEFEREEKTGKAGYIENIVETQQTQLN